MICKHCGNNIENNATFCPICGKIVSDGTSVGVVEIDCDDERRDSLGGRILGFGIMSLVFVNTFFLSFLGIIFGADVLVVSALVIMVAARDGVGNNAVKTVELSRNELPLVDVLRFSVFSYLVGRVGRECVDRVAKSENVRYFS